MSVLCSKLRSLTVLCLLAWPCLLPADALAHDDRSFLGRWVGATGDIGVEYFRWQEFDSRGRRLLTEQGPRYVMEAFVGNGFRRGWLPLYGIKLRGYVGDVDYDGQDSNRIFTSSDTTYRGWNVETQTGVRVPIAGTFSLDMLLAAGIDDWRRDIDNSINANGDPVGGFAENYTVKYGRIGLGALWRAGRVHHYLQVGAKRPWSIDEDPGALNISLSPGKKWSAYLSYEMRFRRLWVGRPFIRLYYDSFRFSKSPSEQPQGTTLFVHQPESDLDMLGVSFGYAL